MDELIAEGDKVVARGSWSGTHKGDVKTPFGTMPGTGKQATVQAIAIFRIADGKLAEQRGMFDDLSFFQQVGAIPTPDEVSV